MSSERDPVIENLLRQVPASLKWAQARSLITREHVFVPGAHGAHTDGKGYPHGKGHRREHGDAEGDLRGRGKMGGVLGGQAGQHIQRHTENRDGQDGVRLGPPGMEALRQQAA